MSGDVITLQLPRERPFFGVAQLVLGGLAVRLELSFEQLEDLQVALGELLEQHETEREITVSVRVEGETIHALVGPFDGTLEKELARDSGDSVGWQHGPPAEGPIAPEPTVEPEHSMQATMMPASGSPAGPPPSAPPPVRF